MSKEKAKSSRDEGLDLFDDEDIMDSDVVDLEELDDDIDEDGEGPSLRVSPQARKARARLDVKRRLDAHLERKWFRDHGWDDDDELFKDEFFGDNSRGSRRARQHA